MSALARKAAARWQRQFAVLRPEAPATQSHDDQPSPSARAGSDAPVPAEGMVEAFSRAVLGSLGEPGDGVLGRLIAALGATCTAELLLDRVSADRLSATAADAGEAVTLREAANGIARWAPRIDERGFVRGLEQAHRVGAKFLVPGDPGWPRGVDDLGAHAPIGLWVRGSVDALSLSGRPIALVGARAATGYGEHMTMEISAGLIDRGCAVVSGGAYGIDGMAHRSALASSGVTVAFLAGGVDRFYPMGHDALLQRIVETGAVFSELPCGASPTKWRFLQRNRLIAAASDATVVLEAGMRSGSLNTAGHAAALGRPLGALPGPATSPASAGCHRLMREYDAVCVVDADQVLELAGGAVPTAGNAVAGAGSGSAATEADADAETIRVLDALSSRAPRTVADLARRSGLPASDVMAVLGILELDGVALWRGSGWIRRRRP
ncbi:DNA-processing protein DprA [Agromyces salentinus]|uniref:DNA-processing protein DprA n=1 Tax=Agromyces salentinus TaxID=269421 RepID=A0ABN2MMQ5_9MICO|nr:DNA-processing protein DprA [Agromyces salentinus]